MKINNRKKRITLLPLLLLLSGSYSLSALAGSEPCEPATGSALSYDNSLNEYMKAQENAVGQTYDHTFNAGQQGYQIMCNCTDSDVDTDAILILYTLKSSLPAGHTNNYYKINDHLDVMTSISIPKTSEPVIVPTNKISDATRHRDKDGTGICPQQSTQDTLTTGSEGNLSFYVTKPFVGQLEIPRTAVAEVYATSATSSSNSTKSTVPVAIVYVSGTITVPQSCEINKGEIISVDFGSIGASKFTRLKQPPENYRPNTFDIVYDCTQNGLPVIPSGNKLTMTLEADDVVDQYYLVGRRRTKDNVADIGITVLDSSGISIPFRNGILPMNQSGEGKVTLSAYPINLVGGTLDTGEFSGVATLKIDIK
ncbi:fimbrial protein [Rahnella aquatilis]|uniref:fimbrial protein n=1 Tax=Rahnella aquatilis TaxID=34038 RepID=UPI0036550F8A